MSLGNRSSVVPEKEKSQTCSSHLSHGVVFSTWFVMNFLSRSSSFFHLFQELSSLHNYAGAAAIYSALTHASVSRLTDAWGTLKVNNMYISILCTSHFLGPGRSNNCFYIHL